MSKNPVGRPRLFDEETQRLNIEAVPVSYASLLAVLGEGNMSKGFRAMCAAFSDKVSLDTLTRIGEGDVSAGLNRLCQMYLDAEREAEGA